MVACHHDPVHGSEPGKLSVGASFCHQLPPRFHQGSTVVMGVWRHKEKEHKVYRAHQVSSAKSCICVSNGYCSSNSTKPSSITHILSLIHPR